MSNSISFPTAPSFASSQSSIAETIALSLAHHRTAADVCDLFYGASPPAWQTVERFYDAHATYENPFLTATSRDTISDVHALGHALSRLDVPKPWAVLSALFRMSPDSRWGASWFRGLSMWNEVNNISECDTFGESAFCAIYGLLPRDLRPFSSSWPLLSDIASFQTVTNGQWSSIPYTSSSCLGSTRRPPVRQLLPPQQTPNPPCHYYCPTPQTRDRCTSSTLTCPSGLHRPSTSSSP